VTYTLIPFRETTPPRRGLHEGPYYGRALRRVIEPIPVRPSIVERAAKWWYARTWPAWVCVIAAIAAVTFGIVAAI